MVKKKKPKTLQKVGIEGTYLNTIKAIYKKTRMNIIVSGENIKEFLLDQGNKTSMPTLTTFIQHSFEVLATAIRKGTEIKRIQIGKEEVKLTV